MVRWVVMAVMLAGCGPKPVPKPVPVMQGACGVALTKGLVGQPFVALAGVDLPGPLRVLYPGQETAEAVQAGRLNATVDAAGRITRVYCG